MKRLIYFLFIIFLGACQHPESDIYERNKNNNYISYYNPTEQIPSSDYTPSPTYTIYEEMERTSFAPVYEENNVLPMEVQNGVRFVWIEINDIKLRFIFDTGASSICISTAEALVLFRQGTLREEDFISTQQFQDATGRISEGTKINLRTVKIGDIVLENIEAIIIDNIDAPLLLGQSVLERFARIEIDNDNNEIIFK